MLRMRRVRRDLGIAQRRGEAFGGDRRIVIQMDQIVGDAGVLRLPLPDRLQDGGALELVGVGLVGGRRRHIQGDRIEDLRLVVVGIFCRQRLHLLQVGLHARLLRGLVVVNIHHRQRVDVVALALGPGANRFRLLDRRKPERKIGRRYRAVRIAEQRQRDAPIGDGAFRVGLDRLLVDFLGFRIPERVLVSHRAIEPPLRRLVARCREMHRAQFLIRIFLGQTRCARSKHRHGRNGRRKKKFTHDVLPDADERMTSAPWGARQA